MLKPANKIPNSPRLFPSNFVGQERFALSPFSFPVYCSEHPSYPIHHPFHNAPPPFLPLYHHIFMTFISFSGTIGRVCGDILHVAPLFPPKPKVRFHSFLPHFCLQFVYFSLHHANTVRSFSKPILRAQQSFFQVGVLSSYVFKAHLIGRETFHVCNVQLVKESVLLEGRTR